MSISTTGIQLERGPNWLREAIELISSMRFAISLLTLISIASVIGTVVKQNEPAVNYVNQFGPYWAELFTMMGITSIYNAPWFIVIMAFLVTSTSLCIMRNAPRMLGDMRDFKERVAEKSFAAFSHKGETAVPVGAAQANAAFQALLISQGYTAKATASTDGSATRYAARKGTSNRLGYILAHASIVLICVGGLMDSAVPMHIQAWLGGKQPLRENMFLKDVPPSGKFDEGTVSYRGNILIPEGKRASHSILSFRDGTLVQQLPFELELNRFIVEYHSTGQPKMFASEVTVRDPDGSSFPFRIEVNKPLIHKGIAVYQSSFDDGGSRLKLRGFPLIGGRDYSFVLEGDVGTSTSLSNDSQSQTYSVEFSGFRAINIENMTRADGVPDNSELVEKRFRDSVAAAAGSAAAKEAHKLRNVGPSFSYKLRDKAGQAREYNMYMVPVELEGQRVFLAGMRENPNDQFRYIRFPADENMELTGYMRLRAALNDPTLRAQAADRFATQALPTDGDATQRVQLRESALRGLEMYAGNGQYGADAQGGYAAIARFLEQNVPQEERERAADVIMKVLAGSVQLINDMARQRAGLPPLQQTVENAQFLQTAMNAYSDTIFFGAPIMLQLSEFTQVQASVFQTTRAPGKYLVYLGSLLLVLGVFAMFYVRERRLWAVVEPDPQQSGASRIRFAVQARKRTLDFDAEFDRLKAAVARLGGSQ